MPTNRKRYSVSLPDDLFERLQKDCDRMSALSERKIANKILSIVQQYYRVRSSQPIVFRQAERLSDLPAHARPVIFEAPAPQIAEQPLSQNATSRGEKS